MDVQTALKLAEEQGDADVANAIRQQLETLKRIRGSVAAQDQSCMGCRHAVPNGEVRLCMKNPPTPVVVGTRLEEGREVPVFESVYPEVNQRFTCDWWKPAQPVLEDVTLEMQPEGGDEAA